MDLDDTEFDFCHSISRRCLFIVGFARSNTTFVQNIINTEKAAFIMGEANWHLPKPENDFREWYNRQHVSFGNIPTKSTYVPKLMSHEGIKWYRYASRLAETYQYVGATRWHFPVLIFLCFQKTARRPSLSRDSLILSSCFC